MASESELKVVFNFYEKITPPPKFSTFSEGWRHFGDFIETLDHYVGSQLHKNADARGKSNHIYRPIGLPLSNTFQVAQNFPKIVLVLVLEFRNLQNCSQRLNCASKISLACILVLFCCWRKVTQDRVGHDIKELYPFLTQPLIHWDCWRVIMHVTSRVP